MNTQPLEVSDFSGGITDYYIDGPVNAGQEMDNLFLTPNSKPRTRWGSVIYGDQLPLGASRITKLSRLDTTLFGFQGKRAFFFDAAWTEVVGPTGGNLLTAGDSNSVVTDTDWQEHLFFSSDAYSSIQKLYTDENGDFQARNAGLPAVPAGVSITNPAGAGQTYLYAFCLKYSYMVGTVTYLDRGPVYTYPTTVTGGTITTGNGANITLPVSLPVVENWDEANIEIEIYRTKTTGDVWYLVDTVTLGAASYLDEVEDADLVEQLYTTGGIASNDTPPKAKYVHVVNNFGYYANIKDGTELDTTLILQSKASDPDSVPESFFGRSELPITGLSSIFDRPIVLTNKYIYRIDNFFGDDGTGGMILRRIDDKSGCVSQASLVQTHVGLFWAGEQNFYWTDGLSVKSVTDHLNKTHQLFVASATKRKNIVGAFDPSNQRVYWTVSKDDGTGECDTVFTLDLKYLPAVDQEVRGSGYRGTFTTMSGSSFKPTQIIKLGNYFYRGDTRGYIFKHGEEYFTDPKIDVAESPEDWEEETIIHSYKSCFVDFGGKFYRKWVPRILVSADNTTNLSLAIFSSNDNNRITGELKPIRYRNNITWGDSLPLWGDNLAIWNSQGLIEEWRRFPKGGLRCNYKQVSFTNAYVQIVTSSLIGPATVDATIKTATLGGSYTWLSGIVDYYISFENDDYTRQFKILSRTPTTLVYDDPSDEGPDMNGSYNWVINGTPKGEVLLLNGYVLHWAPISKSHTPFSSGSLGSNPT